MKTYLVGGALRDAWLARQAGAEARPDGPPQPSQPPRSARTSDRDWVVVGSTPEAMSALGYLPVGRDFPVFLHPQTREEYALARTERKTAPGYHGFAFRAAPEVTLEDDLSRRDLSINAMAMPAEAALGPNGPDWVQLVDPHGGLRDLQDRRLRHVTEAFAEDPVRILRLARFAAQLPEFEVAPETMALLRQMVAAGEVDHLVAERVWQEIAKGLQARRPSRMLEVLRDCGALARLLPEVDRLWGVPQRAEYHPEIDTGAHLLLVLDQAALRQAPLSVAFACLCHDLGKGTTPAEMLPRHIGHEQRSVRLLQALCQRWRVPSDCRELADVVAREHGNLHRCLDFGAEALLRLLERCDALRRPARFEDVLLACECDARGRLGMDRQPYPQADRLRRALAAAQSVLPSEVLAPLPAGSAGPAIARALGAARTQAIASALAKELASHTATARTELGRLPGPAAPPTPSTSGGKPSAPIDPNTHTPDTP